MVLIRPAWESCRSRSRAASSAWAPGSARSTRRRPSSPGRCSHEAHRHRLLGLLRRPGVPGVVVPPPRRARGPHLVGAARPGKRCPGAAAAPPRPRPRPRRRLPQPPPPRPLRRPARAVRHAALPPPRPLRRPAARARPRGDPAPAGADVPRARGGRDGLAVRRPRGRGPRAGQGRAVHRHSLRRGPPGRGVRLPGRGRRRGARLHRRHRRLPLPRPPPRRSRPRAHRQRLRRRPRRAARHPPLRVAGGRGGGPGRRRRSAAPHPHPVVERPRRE